MGFDPVLSFFTSVFWVIVLLKNDLLVLLLEMLDGFLEFILQNADIKVSIHPSINPGGIANALPTHTAPNHQETPSKLDCALNQSVTELLSRVLPAPGLAI